MDLRVIVTERCRLRVMITAQDVPVMFAWFVVLMDDGTLRCEIETMTDSHQSLRALRFRSWVTAELDVIAVILSCGRVT